MTFIDTQQHIRFSSDRLVKANLVENNHFFCDLYCLEPDQEQKIHTHAGATKFYYVVSGTGLFTVGDRIESRGPGSLVLADPGEPHGVLNASAQRLVLLVVMAPNPNRPEK